MTRARWAVAFLIAGLGTWGCLFDSSGLTGGHGVDAGPVVMDAEALVTITDAAADAPVDARADVTTFVYPSTATLWATNGHAYEVIRQDGITWTDAKAAAVARGGHLATTTTSDENVFVWNLVEAQTPPVVNNTQNGPWLGGFQPAGSAEPAGGWTWITGEPWTFTDWKPDEPNNASGNEDIVGYYVGPAWADYDQDFQGPGYVVEYEP